MPYKEHENKPVFQEMLHQNAVADNLNAINELINKIQNPETDAISEIDSLTNSMRSSENVDVKSTAICLSILSQSLKNKTKLDFGDFVGSPVDSENIAESLGIIRKLLLDGKALDLADHLLKNGSLSNDTYKKVNEVIH
ncbi:MAG: hypothetical protein WCT49_03005 [Candidatus Paceibacterota bacterium]|jgi:hypothetical protein|nr:hypothetical protein [Candidatus Paceibacterota bacterium]